MKVYALIFEIGISSGHTELIGLFDDTEKAEESKRKHMKKFAHMEHHDSIKEVELNKEINYTMAEW